MVTAVTFCCVMHVHVHPPSFEEAAVCVRACSLGQENMCSLAVTFLTSRTHFSQGSDVRPPGHNRGAIEDEED